MDDLLRPIKYSRNLSDIAQLEETISVRAKPSTPVVKSSPDALLILKESPSINEVEDVLEFLKQQNHGISSIKTPCAATALITQVLVSQTIPDFWTRLKEDETLSATREALLDCMRSIPGLGAILSGLKAITVAYSSKRAPGQSAVSPEQLHILVAFLVELLRGEEFFTQIWVEINSHKNDTTQPTLLWKEFISLVATGRLISTVAESEDAVQQSGKKVNGSWLARGNDYIKWLGKNLASMISRPQIDSDESLDAAARLCSKALTLGYSDALVEELVFQLPLKEDSKLEHLKKLVNRLRAYEQRSFFVSLLRTLLKECLLPTTQKWDISALSKTSIYVAGSAALLHDLIHENEVLKDFVVDLFTKPDATPLTGSTELQRTLLAAISFDEDRIQNAAEKLLERFGDQLFIRHAAIVQQEATAQLLLMTCGYVLRKQPMFLFTIAKSSSQLRGTSNRLNATSSRARWLGMIVSMTISQYTDKEGSQLVFTDESMENEEARWYRKLILVNDRVGQLDDLRKSAKSRKETTVIAIPTRSKSRKPSKTITAPSLAIHQGLRIIELDSGTEEEDDLKPYAKPDSDPEDDDEDPTLVQRNKPKAPVYIRDLILGLRESENYDRHHLALKTAASLIRRKANFGKEVSDHSEELTSILMGLNDQFELDDFLEMRQEALISILVAQPARIAQYLARSCFEGEFSLQQRTTILVALGLGARELAGFKDQDEGGSPNFPSKRLPDHLHKVYGDTSVIGRVASQLEVSMIQPLALDAADKLSGPNALKVRTFSSRMAVEKARRKPIQNELAKIVADHFFFPLTGRWWTQVQAYGNKSIAFSTHLLPTYLRTLGLLLHASGPSTLSLPQMTSELWDLLLSLRSSAINDNNIGVLESLLFTFLTLLEMNEDKQRLATEHGKELVETLEWAKMILHRQEGQVGKGDEEGERVRILAAAVVVRSQEVVQKWQRLMLGDMVDL